LKDSRTKIESTLPLHMTLITLTFDGYWILEVPARSAAA